MNAHSPECEPRPAATASGEDWRAGELSAQSMGLRLLFSCSRSWLCGPLIKVGNDVEIAASPLQCTPRKNRGTGRVVSGPNPSVRPECSWMPWGPAPSGLSPEPQGKQGLLGALGTQQGVGFLLSRPCCCSSCGRGPWGRLGAWPLGWSAVAAGGQAGVVCASLRPQKSYRRSGVESISTGGHLPFVFHF